MEHSTQDYPREYPLFSACGLNCGLCPRFHTDGESRCPGCGAEEFSKKHSACGLLSCSARHGVEFCGLCAEYPCKKYDGAGLYDSFITHQNQLSDFEKVKRIGVAAYRAELNRKGLLLQELLKNYDDGRRKSYFCLAVNLLELEDVESAMVQLKTIDPISATKEKAAAAVGIFENIATKRGVILKLRKAPGREIELGRKAQ